MSLLHRLILAGMIVPGISTAPLWAQGQDTQLSEAFALGTIYLGVDDEGQGGTTTRTSGEEAAQKNRASLEDALANQPGVSSISSGGGSRNEREVFVRGFDRWHVPLSIDGIRIFLPADNRLDHGRFLVPDLAEVQIQKSYVSVINGPGGMGGAINLVTKKPVKAFEGEARIGIDAGNRGDITGRTGYLSLGTKQDLYYAQLTYIRRDSDGFYLSRDYEPVAGYPYQGEGLRKDTETDDSRLNVKVGYTPNATDEYVLSYTKQTGSKSAPYSTLLPVRGYPGTGTGSTQRDWTWPQWDIASLAFYSHTELETGYLKTKVFYNTFENVLSMWDDADHDSQVNPRQRPPVADSVYDDYSVGGSLEYGVSLGDHDLKIASHFRRDVHRATTFPTPGLGTAPRATEHSKEETFSIAIEDSWQLRDDLRIIGGISYDKTEVKEADRTTTSPGYDPLSLDAVNWQLAAVWTPDAGGEYHASISSRTSFPTLFHRYSTGFGTMVPNPDLKAERATNLELGYKGDLGPVAVQGALFYSRVDDVIQSIEIGVDGNGDPLAQRQNLARGNYAGFEIAAAWEVSDRVALNANYTFMDLSIKDPEVNGARITDIPKHKAFIEVNWQATETLTVSPSLEIYGARWSDPAIGSGNRNNPFYTKMGGFALANIDMSWQVSEQAAVGFGIRNLFDRDYAVAEGFPEPGRTFFLTSQVRF